MGELMKAWHGFACPDETDPALRSGLITGTLVLPLPWALGLAWKQLLHALEQPEIS